MSQAPCNRTMWGICSEDLGGKAQCPVRLQTFPEQRLRKQINMEEKLDIGENGPSNGILAEQKSQNHPGWLNATNLISPET